MLSEKLGILHIAPGDIFRREVKNETQLGLRIQKIMARGDLVEDSTTVEIMGNELASKEASSGFVLDGFPRNLAQAKALEDILEKLGIDLDLVINLVVPEDVLLERGMARRVCRVCGRPYNLLSLSPKVPNVCDACGGELYQRDDDKEEAMNERFRVYREATEPLVDYYRGKGILCVVDGEQSVEKVTESILKGVQELKR